MIGDSAMSLERNRNKERPASSWRGTVTRGARRGRSLGRLARGRADDPRDGAKYSIKARVVAGGPARSPRKPERKVRSASRRPRTTSAARRTRRAVIALATRCAEVREVGQGRPTSSWVDGGARRSASNGPSAGPSAAPRERDDVFCLTVDELLTDVAISRRSPRLRAAAPAHYRAEPPRCWVGQPKPIALEDRRDEAASRRESSACAPRPAWRKAPSVWPLPQRHHASRRAEILVGHTRIEGVTVFHARWSGSPLRSTGSIVSHGGAIVDSGPSGSRDLVGEGRHEEVIKRSESSLDATAGTGSSRNARGADVTATFSAAHQSVGGPTSARSDPTTAGDAIPLGRRAP